ncbi:YkgJ family cysteine cluster protein [Pseudomonas flexibilis]|uniref:YkgJ family cysteine cluster protein n=1 Tax=Pseudomonas flexibilis TaxID=706570 RepID=UPI0009431B70|nr:YkgJ family cysteine cluster protein [Pseudomonas flexibilis]
MTFPCTQCGLCCKHVDKSLLTSSLDRGDGVCRHYNFQNRKCSIYEARPEICRIDKSYIHFSKFLTLNEYYKANAEACNSLQLQSNLNTSFRIAIQE